MNDLPEFSCVCDGVNWDDDTQFYTEVFEEESSGFDPAATWVYGGEYYAVKVHMRVPLGLKGTSLVDTWYEMMLHTECAHCYE